MVPHSSLIALLAQFALPQSPPAHPQRLPLLIASEVGTHTKGGEDKRIVEGALEGGEGKELPGAGSP